MFILRGYIRTNKHWLHLLLSIKKMLEPMPRNTNPVSHLSCCYPPFPVKSLVKCNDLAFCTALCHSSLPLVWAEKVPGMGHMSRDGECSVSGCSPGSLSPRCCTNIAFAPAFSTRNSDCHYCLLGQIMIERMLSPRNAFPKSKCISEKLHWQWWCCVCLFLLRM